MDFQVALEKWNPKCSACKIQQLGVSLIPQPWRQVSLGDELIISYNSLCFYFNFILF